MSEDSYDTKLVSEYLQAKGFEVGGMELLEVIKESLRVENIGIIDDRVESSTQWSVKELPISEVQIPNLHRLEEARGDMKEPIGLYGDEQRRREEGIAGVVHLRGGWYRLVDGYRRMNWMITFGQDRGRYIVLT